MAKRLSGSCIEGTADACTMPWRNFKKHLRWIASTDGRLPAGKERVPLRTGRGIRLPA